MSIDICYAQSLLRVIEPQGGRVFILVRGIKVCSPEGDLLSYIKDITLRIVLSNLEQREFDPLQDPFAERKVTL